MPVTLGECQGGTMVWNNELPPTIPPYAVTFKWYGSAMTHRQVNMKRDLTAVEQNLDPSR